MTAAVFLCCSFQWEQSREAARGAERGRPRGWGGKWHTVTQSMQGSSSLVLSPIFWHLFPTYRLRWVSGERTRDEKLFSRTHTPGLCLLWLTLFGSLICHSSFLRFEWSVQPGVVQLLRQSQCRHRFIHLEMRLYLLTVMFWSCFQPPPHPL